MAIGGPMGSLPTLWTSNEAGVDAQVSIWGPEAGATQASIDDLVRFHHDMYRRATTPYAKALTVAGTPATVLDGSTDQVSLLEALAVVDGSLVLIEVSGVHGKPADPTVFEQFVASFAKG
jgi:hypothetical protein